MNVSGFNAAAINSAVPDVTVRAAVIGSAYAMGNVSGRARIRLIAAQLATASAAVNTRMAARNTGAFTVQAIRSGLDKIASRSLINGQAIAQTVHDTHTVLLRLSVSALASAEVTARTARRGVIDGYVSALATLTSHRAARNPANSLVEAQALPTSRVLTRIQTDASASAQSTLTPKAARRSVVSEQALAMGFVGAHSTVFYPFDEPALEENTFIVGFEDNIFCVR